MSQYTREGLLIIKNEILTDPTGKGYAGKTAVQQETLINQPIVTIIAGPIPSLPFAFYLLKNGKVATATRDVFNYLVSGQFTIAPGADVDTLATLLTLTATQKTEVVALGNITTSTTRAQQLAFALITAQDIAEALATT